MPNLVQTHLDVFLASLRGGFNGDGRMVLVVKVGVNDLSLLVLVLAEENSVALLEVTRVELLTDDETQLSDRCFHFSKYCPG